MIITYFDRKDEFEVKTLKCYRIIPLAGGAEVICKSKGLDPVFILNEDVIYISEETTNPCEKCTYNPTYGSVVKGADNEKIS